MNQQRTPEWYAARLGKVTASRIDAVMATGKGGGPSLTRAAYLADLLLERLTGQPADSYRSADMERGQEIEPLAVAAYEARRDVLVEPVSFVPHPTIPNSGASPDGLVDADGLVEIKCPKSHTHLATLKGATIDRGYRLQMQWQMACTGRAWCDFVSFDPRMPAHLQLHVTRVERDAELIAEVEAGVRQFLDELAADERRFALEAA